MDVVSILPAEQIGKKFIPDQYLPKGKDEYYIREEQSLWPSEKWRHLTADEVERLVKNNNSSSSWENILVNDTFDPGQVINSKFYGRVRIGALPNAFLKHHDLQIPVGISNSVIISCDIGNNVAIHNVRYLAHYIIGNRCILANIDEMHTTDHAKFGNGIVKDGESESVRTWMEIMNETGSRSVLPFDGMIPADAWLWARYRDDTKLQEKLVEITQNTFDSRRGYYGTVQEQCVIKNSRIVKDAKIGSHCYIKGANKLKNLTINSSADEQTMIGEGVEMVNGIIGYGCHVFYGCKAVRFVLGNKSSLKYGARLIHSYLGANSTISCCEVLNNLIFPAHEQHHNNSFLIASMVKGQSNLAAGATIGSNHNSRANDNEVEAGRGFWPGLCSSIKHSCKFASFVLLAKADYPAEMNIPLPFSLLNNNTSKDHLEVYPAFWWLHNMYALARNTWKFQKRDKRKNKIQNIEFDSLAPDTIEEIIQAMELLEIWTAKAYLTKKGEPVESQDDHSLRILGKELLSQKDPNLDNLCVLGENMEKTRRPTVILNSQKSYHAYIDMLLYYAVKNLMDYMQNNPSATFETLQKDLSGDREINWLNLGGQLIPEKDLDNIRKEIGANKLKSWNEIHSRYDSYWEQYSFLKQKHAFAILCHLYETDTLSKEVWIETLDKAIKIQEFIRDQVYNSRKKDYENPYRQATYRSMEEMTAAIGTIDDNDFVIQVKEETEDFKKEIEKLKKRG